MMNDKKYFVYILTNKRNGTLYTGITNNLLRRILEHKEKVNTGFPTKYGLDKLIHYEVFDYINDAIRREANIKAWKRKWKLELIEENNWEWKDLFYDLFSKKEIEEMRKLIIESYITSG